jgi:membrane protein implicated in regulation of membrane protease activity
MPAWLVWMIVAAVLGVVELLTLTVAAGLLAVAAVAAAVTAALGAGAAGQAAAFAVAAGVSMAVVLPTVRRHRRAGHPAARTGVAALVGQSALVIEPVDDHHRGRVRINGEIWSARAFTPGQVIPAGAVVDVFEIDGATALVYAEERS